MAQPTPIQVCLKCGMQRTSTGPTCTFCGATFPIVPSMAPAPQVAAGTTAPVACPRCGRPATYVAQYGRHYCVSCQQYTPATPAAVPTAAPERPAVAASMAAPAAPPAAPSTSGAATCPQCGRPATYVAQYGRYYCLSCKQYTPTSPSSAPASPPEAAPPAAAPVAAPAAAPPAPSPGTPPVNCPRCGRAATFIAQYNRHYCYSCQQYT